MQTVSMAIGADPKAIKTPGVIDFRVSRRAPTVVDFRSLNWQLLPSVKNVTHELLSDAGNNHCV